MFKKLPSAFFSLCLCGASVALALEEPAPAQPPQDTGGETGPLIAAQTGAAIEALGTNPGTRQISTIVFKAVRSSPDNVLVIVDAASRVAPPAAVPEIMTAAVAAVPNPWKQVTYHRLHGKNSEPDYKGGPGGRQARNGERDMDLGGREPGATGGRGTQGTSGRTGGNLANGGAGQSAFDPSQSGNAADGTIMTLAEAIAQTAFHARPGLSFAALTAAVDLALRTDPATLMRHIQSPRAASGVGDAGLSNYANEPLRTPKQPVVSR